MDIDYALIKMAAAKYGSINAFAKAYNISVSTVYACKGRQKGMTEQLKRKVYEACMDAVGPNAAPVPAKSVPVPYIPKSQPAKDAVSTRVTVGLTARDMVKMAERNAKAMIEEDTDDEDPVETLVTKILPELVGILPKMIKQGKTARAYKSAFKALDYMLEREKDG